MTIRPIRADDRKRLQRSHERLSEQTRYRRFMSSRPSLSTADARYLAEVDGCDHHALVATIDDQVDEAIIGVARYVRLPGDPAGAEFAIVVADAWQGQGLATELLGRLADAAVTRGVQRFYATILADNVAIRHMIERLTPGRVSTRRQGNVLEVEFPLLIRGDIAPPTRGAPAMIAACAGS